MDKIIAIGNTLMGDDGIAVYAVSKIRKALEDLNFKVIICETDIDFAICSIRDKDRIFIVDSMISKKSLGEITFVKYKNRCIKDYSFSEHALNIFDLLKLYDINVDLYIIGIEIKSVDFSMCLSEELSEKIQYICNKIVLIFSNIK